MQESTVIAFISGSILVALVGYLWARFYFSKATTIKRKLKRAQRMSVRDFSDGTHGKIVGQLSYSGKPLRAPLSGRSCAYYEVVVKKHQTIGNTAYCWVIAQEEKGQEFILGDSTGKAIVPISEAEILVRKDKHYRSGRFNDATPQLVAFLANHGLKSTDFLGFNITLSYKEGVLAKGKSVAVSGVVRRCDDRLVFEKRDGVSPYVSNIESTL